MDKYRLSPLAHAIWTAARSGSVLEFSAEDLVDWNWVLGDIQIAYTVMRELKLYNYINRTSCDNSTPYPRRKYRLAEVCHV
jgi:hypothetical protein